MPNSLAHRTPAVYLGCLLAAVASLTSTALAADAPAARPAPPVATPEQLETLPGFKVEMILKADRDKHGSWISMAKDPKGRLLLAGQARQPITRVTIHDGKVVKDEPLTLHVAGKDEKDQPKLPSEAMGMLWAFDSLYVNGQVGTKFGLYRLHSSNGGDDFDGVELLREWKGGSGEHGAHGILLGPDKKLYVVCGNFVELPTDLLPSSPHRNYADDRPLPRAEDGNGFGAGKKPPGGFICRMDPDGKNPELFASGERNTYDVAFNADGELFGFDSDMEWDWGTPWYRPIRVFHAASGADHGFREGTAKWPTYYEDSLPPVVNVGIGCPTGVAFGYGAKFPARYQKAFYVLDWSYGRLIAVHLNPKGATYGATWEDLVAPKSLHADSGKTPLNLTDVVIGDDGAMYFTIGGRNTQAALYRVTYTGSESTASVDAHDNDGAQARTLRHELEAFQGKQDPKAVESAWPHLASRDRSIRYAARLAIESQPVAEWKDKALAETKPQAAMTALLALVRLGGKDVQPELLKALAKFPISSLPVALQREKLRVLEVSISRQGKPSPELAKQVIDELDPVYPADQAKHPWINAELCQVLLALDAPDAVAKTMKLLAGAPTQEEQILYVHHLRTIKNGWTPELRREYFSWWTKDHGKADPSQHAKNVVKWFEDAGVRYSNGASFPRFLANFHADAQKTLSPEEKQSLADVLAAYTPPAQPGRRNQPAPRSFVKAWTMADLEPSLADVGKGRNFRRGQLAYEAAQCAACHKLGDTGGAVGPDLTTVSSRFTRRDILESILEPSKVVSEQYANTTVRLNDGDAVEGRIVEETPEALVVQPNPLKPDKVTLKKADVKSRGLSKLSPMPEGAVNVLSKDEILDLIAYVESGGRRDHPDFRRE